MTADALRSAYEALLRGEPDPLVSLMSDDMVWFGRRHGWRFWRPVPS